MSTTEGAAPARPDDAAAPVNDAPVAAGAPEPRVLHRRSRLILGFLIGSALSASAGVAVWQAIEARALKAQLAWSMKAVTPLQEQIAELELDLEAKEKKLVKLEREVAIAQSQVRFQEERVQSVLSESSGKPDDASSGYSGECDLSGSTANMMSALTGCINRMNAAERRPPKS